jgi:uncharacterized protein (UPF0335 family)
MLCLIIPLKPLGISIVLAMTLWVSASDSVFQCARAIALQRETSRSDLVREAIKQYIEKLEKPEEQNPKIPDRALNKILKECTKEDGGFEIDGEDGFIAKMMEKGFKLKDLTPEQWERELCCPTIKT